MRILQKHRSETVAYRAHERYISVRVAEPTVRRQRLGTVFERGGRTTSHALERTMKGGRVREVVPIPSPQRPTEVYFGLPDETHRNSISVDSVGITKTSTRRRLKPDPSPAHQSNANTNS